MLTTHLVQHVDGGNRYVIRLLKDGVLTDWVCGGFLPLYAACAVAEHAGWPLPPTNMPGGK